MSTTVAQCIADARRLLADTYDEAFEAADLLAYLNEGMRRFAAETHVCQGSVTKTVTSSPVALSTLTEDQADEDEVLIVAKIELTDGTDRIPLPKAPIYEMKTRTGTTPTRYMLFDQAIHFDVVGTVSITFTAYYSYIPTRLLSTDSLPFADEYAPAMVRYMVYCAHLSMRDAGMANGAFSEYQELRQLAVSNVAARVG